jgi:hypothetical protein
MVLVAVFENGRGPDELAADLERVLDLKGRRNGLESRLVDFRAEAIQAVNGRQGKVSSLVLSAFLYRGGCVWASTLKH